MKKVLVILFSIFMLFTLTACGNDKKEESNKGNDSSQKEEKESIPTPTPEENNNEYIIDDDEIIEFDDEDNKPIDNTPVVVSEVINCPGCVYAYFDKEGDAAKRIGYTVSPSEYTTDINNLKKGGKQRHNFFGLVLEGNIISGAYACILKDSKIYCIQGSDNGAHHESNIGVLKKVFTDDQCKTISAGHTYTCTDGNYNGDTITTGYVSFLYETGCTIYGNENSNSGKLICH